MRSTVEIICAVKECKPATEEELRMALIVMSSCEYFLKRNIENILEAMEQGKPFLIEFGATEAKKWLRERLFEIHKADPLVWLGPENTPGNPEHDQRLAAGLRLIDRLMKDREDKI